MTTQSVFISLVLIFAVCACEEKDAPLLEGEIRGSVSLIDAYGFPLTDKSGVQVLLNEEDAEFETITDFDGRYRFQDMPFGNYHINLIRKNFIENKRNFSFGHVGGDAPTLTSQVMNEIPEFYYGIDSMTYYPGTLKIYMHTIGANKAFSNDRNFYVHCFFSQSPDVSSENYENSFIENISAGDDIHWVFWWGYYNFIKVYTGTVYCRVYPQTSVDYMWYNNDSAGPHPVYPETLGKPSEVFSFTIEGITRTNPNL